MGDTPDSERVTYHASCQCGMAQYSVRMRPLEKQSVIKDNCSICVRNGYLFAYAPRSDIRWKQGYAGLKGFRFNTKTREHKFCPECGSSMMLDLLNSLPKDLIALNVSG